LKRKRFLYLIFSLFLILPSLYLSAQTDLFREAEEHLEVWHLSRAEETAARLLRENPESLEALDLNARVKFYQGRYEEALKFLQQGLAVEASDTQRHAFSLFTQRTHDTVKQLKRYESAHFILYLDEARDGILVPYVLDAMEKTYQAIGSALGYYPETKVRIEIAPDVPSFNAISTLSLRDIEETGAVGICKFNKIMTISPRALIRGYRWLDSLSHEYLHYAIVGLTDNKAPIWLHEGMARFYETRWRNAGSSKEKEDYLTPPNETLLAQALEKDDFVGFKNMEPSLIHLDTPEQVQLAYAEAASAIDFVTDHQGPQGIQRLLAEVGKRPTPEAIEEVLGITFETFETEWKDFLKRKQLKEIEGSRVRKLKVKGSDKGDKETVELKEIQSVRARNQTQLADRLQERGKIKAAVIEYRRALRVSPHSTIILQKLARLLNRMQRYDEALPILKKIQMLDPDHVDTYVQLGRLYHAEKNYAEARVALEEAIQINPYNPAVHSLLSEIYTAFGKSEQAEKSRATLRKLMTSP
jgi:tetratricopeptide (TPR) repeat protein